MKPYTVQHVQDGTKTYFFLCSGMTMEVDTTKYLKYKTKTRSSPNTVKRIAFSLSYYLAYLDENKLSVREVFDLNFGAQQIHFVEFLQWIQVGKHTHRSRTPQNATCNAYLKDVFGWLQFIERMDSQIRLKVLFDSTLSVAGAAGVRHSKRRRSFQAYLPEDHHIRNTVEKEHILLLLEHCSNIRDQLLLLILAETGLRIGETLGILYTQDIDYEKHNIIVRYREGNENGARAKHAEYRRAKLSAQTFHYLMCYLSEYRDLLRHTQYLFILLSGKQVGRPLNVDAVYAMLRRLMKQTGLAVTPHMLRHYYANERRRAGWDILLISRALGHRHISTTERYLDIGAEEVVEASEKYYEKYGDLYPIDAVLNTRR